MEIKNLDPKSVLNVTRLKTIKDVDELLMPWFHVSNEVGWDIETTFERQFFNRKIRTVQFGTKDKQFVLDLLDFVDGDSELLYNCQGWYGSALPSAPKLEKLIQKLKPVLCSNKWLKIGVNLGFEYNSFYWGLGVSPWNLYDCAMVERVKVAGIQFLGPTSFFSMEEMMLRYYGIQIDKTLQKTFDLKTPLTPEQIEYAALDTRLPLAIRYRQLNGYSRDGQYVPGVIDEDLLRTCEIENNVIMSFEQMHVHGEKIDIAAWTKRVGEQVVKYNDVLKKLDDLFIPVVGSKDKIITEEMVLEAEAKWKAIKDTKDTKRAWLKMSHGELRRERKRQLDLVEGAQGQALINYDSPLLLKDILKKNFAGCEGLTSTDDDVLKNYEGIEVIDVLRDYREVAKQISTYGYAWAKEWVTHPCNEEGWLSPYTGKLHSVFNQLMADTGRSSSDNPNGQNLPRVKEVRSCFIAEAGMVYVTCDMSGAELRIIAELANAKTWIDAFNRGEDLHSVGCEILFPVEWPAEAEPGCAYYATNENGEPKRHKCNCKKHKARREITKAINFFLAYGGVASTLANKIGVTAEEAGEIMANHEAKFPDIWAYLSESGDAVRENYEARDMFGRRRLFRAPTPESGRAKIIKYWKKSLELPKEVAENNIKEWMEKTGSKKKPTGEIKTWLTHREPTAWEIKKAMRSIAGGIERQGKNHCIQATNASIIKLAMGSGYSPSGRPYLFHTLPLLGAKLVKMVHDELVVTCPEANGDKVAKLVGIAFKTAAAEVMSKVVMEFDFKISKCWEK